MKFVAKILAALAITIFLTGNIEIAHAEKIFAGRTTFTPPRLRQLFPDAFKAPRRDYPSRIPVKPAPRYRPSKPEPSRDNRGRGVPRAPHR